MSKDATKKARRAAEGGELARRDDTTETGLTAAQHLSNQFVRVSNGIKNVPHGHAATVVTGGTAAAIGAGIGAETFHAMAATTPTLYVAAGAMAAVTTGASWLNVKYRRELRRHHKRFWKGAGLSALGAAAMVVGGHEFVIALTMLGVNGWYAWPWLRANRQALSPPRSAKRPMAVGKTHDYPTILANRIAATWKENISDKSGPMKGSYLFDHREVENGHYWGVQLDRNPSGEVEYSNIKSQIARALGCDPRQVIVEPHPPVPGAQFRDASKMAFTFLTSSPLVDGVRYEAPMYDGGKIQLGPYGDGVGWAEWHLYTPDEGSVWSGSIFGSTGSGKSGATGGLLASARAALPIVTMYLDMKGSSSPDIRRNATVAATRDEAEAFTRAVENVVDGRRIESEAHGISSFTASDQRPIVQVIIDESDLLFKMPDMATRWAAIAKTGRSLGVCILVITQYTGLDGFGQNELLRSSLLRNVLLMRTDSKSSDGLVTDGMPPSRNLPQQAGYAYLKSIDSRPTTELRCAYLPDSGREPDGYNVDKALKQHPDAPMDRVVKVAVLHLLDGSDHAADREAIRQESARRKLERFLAGEPMPELPQQPGGSTTTEDGMEMGNVVQYPTPPVPGGDGLSAKASTALGWIEQFADSASDGVVRTHQIAEATGWSRDTVARALRELQAAGRIAPGSKQGRWTRTAQSLPA